MCKKPTGYRKNLDLTEECFQNGTLNFVGDTQWIQDASRAGVGKTHNRTAIPALRKSEGTFPPGSQWTINPIPGCTGSYGTKDFCHGPGQFYPPKTKPPVPGVWGAYSGPETYPTNLGFSKDHHLVIPDVVVVDLVEVPKDLAPGDYVLQFRQ